MVDRQAYVLEKVSRIAEKVRTANPSLPEVMVRWIDRADGGCGDTPPYSHDDKPWVRAHAHSEPFYNGLICLHWPTEPDWFILNNRTIAELMAHEILHITLPGEDHLSSLFKRRVKEAYQAWWDDNHIPVEYDPDDPLL